MVTIRKIPIVTGEVYHIFNKSIAEYKIFNNQEEFLRMKEVIRYYQRGKRLLRFSKLKEIKNKKTIEDIANEKKLVDIIAYCIMPTHFHLILKQLEDKGISIFVSRISNSYARYFNLKHKRKGPLWEREFRNVLVSSEAQLLHLTRYIHLNPATAFLVDKPEEWQASSYKEFLQEVNENQKDCNFSSLLNIDPVQYRKFVENRISYQRELKEIENIVLE